MKPFLSVFLITLASLSTLAHSADTPTTKPVKSVYDEQADARADIAAAEAKATREDQRVLLVIGGNWCSWCKTLDGVMKTDKPMKTELMNDFKIVHVDVGPDSKKNAELLSGYGITATSFPYLAILDAKTNKLVTQMETGQFEVKSDKGQAYDAAKIVDRLAANAIALTDARIVLASALDEAKTSDRRVFLRFGAPWCGWCHKLDDVLYSPGVMDGLNKDFVIVKVDVDRMSGGEEMLKKYQKSGGIPWFAVLSSDGEVQSTSELNGNNVGFPSEPAEVEHVSKMLTGSRKAMSESDAALFSTALNDTIKKIKADNH